jgi:6-phosphogluconolactonase
VVISEDHAGQASSRIAGLLQALLEANGRASLALTGGRTPRPVYEALAARPDIPWDRVSIYFGDERCVPPDDEASNFRMARECLLDPAGIPEANIHRIQGEDPDHEAAAVRYEAALPGRLDVLLLGIGEDGHIASLFPGSRALEATRRVVWVEGPKPPADRITITPPVIAAAGTRVIMARGQPKARAVHAALSGDAGPSEVPARLVRDALWILDAAAASLLEDR